VRGSTHRAPPSCAPVLRRGGHKRVPSRSRGSLRFIPRCPCGCAGSRRSGFARRPTNAGQNSAQRCTCAEEPRAKTAPSEIRAVASRRGDATGRRATEELRMFLPFRKKTSARCRLLAGSPNPGCLGCTRVAGGLGDRSALSSVPWRHRWRVRRSDLRGCGIAPRQARALGESPIPLHDVAMGATRLDAPALRPCPEVGYRRVTSLDGSAAKAFPAGRPVARQLPSCPNSSGRQWRVNAWLGRALPLSQL
jgi:hypothetical protein